MICVGETATFIAARTVNSLKEANYNEGTMTAVADGFSRMGRPSENSRSDRSLSGCKSDDHSQSFDTGSSKRSGGVMNLELL